MKPRPAVTVRVAREAALDWLAGHAERLPGFRGAWWIGSSASLPPEAVLAPHSDLDVAVALDCDETSLARGKLLHRGALLEISIFPWRELQAADAVATSYHLAAGLATDTVVADPTGALCALQREIAHSFRDERRVLARCEDAVRRVERFLGELEAAETWHDRVNAWLFATGVTTHVLLVAALANPTVRLRYLAVRSVLDAYGRGELYRRLLDLLGCAELPPERVAHHLDALARSFDAAAAVARTAFPFRSDVTPIARPIAIDGSRALIEAGAPREAVFWMLATFVRCARIFAADAPPGLAAEHAPALAALLADVGIRSPADLASRAAAVRAFLPELRAAAAAIVAANPGIERSARR